MGWFTSSKKKKSEDEAPPEKPTLRTNKANDLFVSLKQVPTALVSVLGERGSGKSLLSNLVCREPIFPLEGHAYGTTYAATPLTWQELSEMYGLSSSKSQSQSSAVLFAEYGSDRPPEALHILPLMRVSTLIVINTFFDPDPFNYLQQWFSFVPYVSAQMEAKGYRPFGELMVVLRDWNDSYMPQEDYTASVWNYEQMPQSVADSDEERRNVIRYHIQRVFKAINMYFLPFPVKVPSQLKSRVFQTKALVPEFTNKFSEFTYDLLERIRTPKTADNGEVVMGKHINNITNTIDPRENALTFDDLADLYQKSVSQLHEEHGVINFRRHLQHLKELVEYHMVPPINPDTLTSDFNGIVSRVEGLLRNILHVSTPVEVRDRLCADLWNEAKPQLSQMKEENTAVIRGMQAEFVQSCSVAVEKEWEIIAQNPRQKEVLKKMIEDKLEEVFDRQISLSKFAKIINETLRSDMFDDLKAQMSRTYSEILEINEDSCEQLIEKEKDNVKSQAQVKFRELDWQSKDHPFTNRELIHLISRWIDDVVSQSKKKMSKQLEGGRLDSYGKTLALELRQMSSTCVLSNLENANSKISLEVEECLDFYRNQVLAPQIQACAINVTAQTRELIELYNLCVGNPAHLQRFTNSLKQPQDFLTPFKALSFLERTFIFVLLERAEFLCSVSDLAQAHTRQKTAGKMEEKKESALMLQDGGGNNNNQLALLPVPAAGGNKRGGRNRSPSRTSNNGLQSQGLGPNGRPESAAQRRQREALEKQNVNNQTIGNQTSDQTKVMDWLNLPSGVPHLQTDQPAPSQQAMQSIMQGAIVPVTGQVKNFNNNNDIDNVDGESESNFSDWNALALVHAPGVEMPQTFAEFKVLSADIIDKIWASLKQMVEDDTSDLVRRQRQRDERYRLLVKLMPTKPREEISQKNFSHLYASEMMANLPEGSSGQQQDNMHQGPLALSNMPHLQPGAFNQPMGVISEIGTPRQSFSMGGQQGHGPGGQRGSISGGGGNNNNMNFQNGQNAPAHPNYNQGQMTPQGPIPGSKLGANMMGGSNTVVSQQNPMTTNNMNTNNNNIQQLQNPNNMTTNAGQIDLSQLQSAIPSNNVEAEVAKLRELIQMQQTTLVSQQKALAEATEALDFVRSEKDQILHQQRNREEKALRDWAARPNQKGGKNPKYIPLDPDEPDPNAERRAAYQDMKNKMLDRLTSAAKTTRRRKDGGGGSGGQNGEVCEEVPGTGRGNRAMRTCQWCKKTFTVSENGPRACRYHKGRWVTAPNRGKAGMFAKVAVGVMMGSDDINEVSDEVGKWTCCGAKFKEAPGCVVDRHQAMERMRT